MEAYDAQSNGMGVRFPKLYKLAREIEEKRYMVDNRTGAHISAIGKLVLSPGVIYSRISCIDV